MKKLAVTLIACILFSACSEVTEPTETQIPESQLPPSESSTTEETLTSEVSEAEGVVQETIDSDLMNMSTIDIYGEEYSVELFAENDLTLVNVWATWCPACIQSMPMLAELEKELDGTGVGVVGLMTDAVSNGTLDEQAIAVGRQIEESALTEYPNLIVDQTLYEEILTSVQVFPTYMLVDSNGNLVGEMYEGSRDNETWKEIINAELTNLE